jgi:hypothetical protein
MPMRKMYSLCAQRQAQEYVRQNRYHKTSTITIEILPDPQNPLSVRVNKEWEREEKGKGVP